MPSIDRPRAGRGEPSKSRTASSSKPPTQQHQLTKVAPSLALNLSAGSSSAMALVPPPYKFSRPRSSRWAARRRADECGHGLGNVGHNRIGLSSAHCRFRACRFRFLWTQVPNLEHARLRSLTNNVESQAQARSPSALGDILPARVGPVTPERPKLRTEQCAGVIKRQAWYCVAATQKVWQGRHKG